MSRSKYNARKTIVDGITFDSLLEATAYRYFKYSDRYCILDLQPRFELQESFKHGGMTYRKIEYVADFLIHDSKTQRTIVVDAKGMETPVFKIKLKMLLMKEPHMDFLIFKSPRQFEKLLG